jgi:hypothetical protein
MHVAASLHGALVAGMSRIREFVGAMTPRRHIRALRKHARPSMRRGACAGRPIRKHRVRVAKIEQSPGMAGRAKCRAGGECVRRELLPPENPMPSISRTALALAVALPLLHGCGGSSDQGYVRLVNATTDYSALSLYESTSELSDSIASDAVGSYAGLDPATYDLDIRSAGSSSNAATTSQAVATGDHFTLVAYVNAGTLETTTLTDDEDQPSSGYAKLRIFNAAPTAAASVDVYVTATACGSLTTADTAVATAVTGLQDGYASVVAASGGSSWHVCVTGTGDRSDLRLDIPALTLTSQQIATLILTKTTGGVLMNGLLLNQQGTLTSYANTNVRLRLVADAANGGVVSASANGTTLGTDYASPTVSAWRTVAAGDLALTLTIDAVAITKTGLTAAAGGDYTLLVAGTAAAPTISVLTEDDSTSTTSSLPVRMRFVNGLNGIAGSAMLTADGVVVGDSVAFGAASADANIAASAAAASLQVTQAGTTLWQVSGQTLTSGNVYTVFLLGDANAVHGVLRVDN